MQVEGSHLRGPPVYYTIGKGVLLVRLPALPLYDLHVKRIVAGKIGETDAAILPKVGGISFFLVFHTFYRHATLQIAFNDPVFRSGFIFCPLCFISG